MRELLHAIDAERSKQSVAAMDCHEITTKLRWLCALLFIITVHSRSPDDGQEFPEIFVMLAPNAFTPHLPCLNVAPTSVDRKLLLVFLNSVTKG